LTVAAAGVLAQLIYLYMASGVGQISEAIRENEIRVEYLGLSPYWLIYGDYLLAAAISAIGGALISFATSHVDPEMAIWTTSGEFVFIALLGGSTHVAAPFIATLLFAVVRTFALQFAPNTWQMTLGVVLLVIIVFLPKGLWSLLQRDARTPA
jgi:branched-chain amino acid transport system permease protein